MLENASDYEYLPTAGIESALSGAILPVCDVAGMDSAYLYHDFCYLSEMLRVWIYNGNSSNLNIDYTRKMKYYLVESMWKVVYERLDPTTNGNSGAYGCDIFLSASIEQLPTMRRYNSNSVTEKQALRDAGLLLDLTPYMDANQWSSGGSLGLKINTCPFASSVIRTLYWVMFHECYQEMKGATDSMTEYYDKSCTWAPRTMKSGTATVHQTSSGTITTVPAEVKNYSDDAYYIDVRCVPESGSRTSYPLVLTNYRYYGTTPGGQYESGYEYCYDGVDGDAYINIDFRRDDILSAYALVEYAASNQSTYRETRQFKLEQLTQDSGRRWSFKVVDKAFAQSLMEYAGADFSKVGTRTPSATYTGYSCNSYIHYIFVKFNHKYASGIADIWQWQPPQS